MGFNSGFKGLITCSNLRLELPSVLSLETFTSAPISAIPFLVFPHNLINLVISKKSAAITILFVPFICDHYQRNIQAVSTFHCFSRGLICSIGNVNRFSGFVFVSFLILLPWTKTHRQTDIISCTYLVKDEISHFLYLSFTCRQGLSLFYT